MFLKKIIILSIILLLSITSSFGVVSPKAMFSPQKGSQAFDKIYQKIEHAKEYVHLTIYSWSGTGLINAIKNSLKKNPTLKVRVVVHPGRLGKAKREKFMQKIAPLEIAGAMFKKASQNMHEKFVIIDDEFLVNTSANFTRGPLISYSEDFIFMNDKLENDSVHSIIEEFKKEFSILWNSASDIITPNERTKADYIDMQKNIKNIPSNYPTIKLYSSSMNFNIRQLKEANKNRQQIKLDKRYIETCQRPKKPLMEKGKNVDQESYKKEIKQWQQDVDKCRPWVVKNKIISSINQANHSIYLRLNHFNLYEISNALIRAIERGVIVKLAVDNLEYKTYINDFWKKPTIEMTPRFIRDWKKINGNENIEAPVRFKYYSHAPHFASWKLNHHKFILIDYGPNQLDKTILLAGSYNLSRTAELKQFDNLVAYQGPQYEPLFKSYYKQFKHLWYFNRDRQDTPNLDIINNFFQPINKDNLSYIIHNNQAVSLTWNEIFDLRKRIKTIAPKMFKGLNTKTKGCSFYNPIKDEYWNGKYCINE